MRFFRNRSSKPKAWHSAAVGAGGDGDHNIPAAASFDDGKRSRRTSYCPTEGQTTSDFNNIASGRSTPTHMHHHNDNNGDDKKWMRRCQLLQRCVEEFDVEERYYQERIHSLERQLERLLAADGGVDADDYHQSRRLKKSMSCETDATIPLSSSASYSSLPNTQIDDDQSNVLHDHDARQEIASLEELLSKVVAENKVLKSKCQNLTKIIKSYDTPPDVNNETSTLPPSIMDIDLTLALESCTPNTASNEEPITYVMHLKGNKDEYGVIYKSRVNGDLILKVNEHHEDTWRKIKEYRKKRNKKSAKSVKYASTKFANSDFADHIVSCYLYNAKSLKEVKAWWQDNVKILEKL